MKTPHTSFPKNTKVRVVLRNGIVVVDKYLDSKSGCVILEKVGRVYLSQIRSIGYCKDRNRA